jgi:GAF domain-containing protein/PAS domain-containing protein
LEQEPKTDTVSENASVIKFSQVDNVNKDSEAVVQVLLVQKDCRSANALGAQLRAPRDLVFDIECVQDVETATQRLSRQAPDAVLLDLDLPGAYDLDALITLHLSAPQVPILVFAETMDMERGRGAVRAGAQAFLTRAEIEAPLIARELVFAMERHALRSATHSHKEQLQFSEARFRLLINENADGIVVVNTLGAIRFVNPAAEALFGKTRQELLGSTFRAPLEQPTIAVIEITRGQEKVWVQQRVVKTMWDHEDAYVATLRDVTAQQRDADVLRMFAARYRELVELYAAGIWRCRLTKPLSIRLPVELQVRAIFDTAYMEECSPALARLYGFQSPRELVGRALSENTRRDDAVNLETYREFVRQQYRLKEGETHETDRFGNPRIFRTTLYGIVENDGLVEIWGAPRDVTAEGATTAEMQAAEKTQRHHQQVAQALADSAAALNSTLSFEQVLDRILENVGRVVPHDAASVFLIESDQVRIVRARGFEERGLGKLVTDWRLPVAALKSLEQMRATREALVISDTQADPHWINLSFDWIASYVGAPMCVRDEVIGFLNVDSSIPNFYGETHAAALKAFADQAATALDNARLHAQVKKRAEEWAQVYDLVRELGMQLDVSLMLEALVKRVTELVHAPCGSVSLYLPETQELDVQFIVGEPESLLGTKFKLGQGVVGRVALTRQSLIVEDYRTFEHRLPEAMERQIAAVLSVPMLFGGEVEGVLTVRERGDSPRRFTQDDAQLLTLIAAQAAALIHNARLHQETEKRAQQLALVYDAGLTLNRVLEPRTQLDFLLRIAMRSVRAERAIFFRYEAASSELVVDLELGFDTLERPYSYKRRVL